MSETTYPIYCEKCSAELGGAWSPTPGTQPTEEQIYKFTHTGYLCEICAQPAPLMEDP